MQTALGRLVVVLGLAGLAGCAAGAGYDAGYAGPSYGSPSYGGSVEYGAPIYRDYGPRRGYYEPEYGRRDLPGGYRQERRFEERRLEERRQPEREERRAAPPPPREERRPGPGIRAPFDRSSAPAPRYAGPAEPRQGPMMGDREGGH